MRMLNSCMNEFSVCFSDILLSAVNPFLSAFVFNAAFLAFCSICLNAVLFFCARL